MSKKKHNKHAKHAKRQETVYLNVFERLLKERTFLIFIGIAFIAAGFATLNWRVSMWFGFAFTAYAAVANDSIQSLGTFIESNKHRKWWVLWLFTGGILIATLTFSYIYYDGDVPTTALLMMRAIPNTLSQHSFHTSSL